MKIFTYQIGQASGNQMTMLCHAETVSADDLPEAIQIAKDLTRKKYAAVDANLVRLLEELEDDCRIVWFRPRNAIT